MNSPNNNKIKNLLSRPNFLFLCSLFLLILPFIYLITTYRIPKSHDAFFYFYLQYYFLNNAVVSGEIPQWIPFITQGGLSSWWFTLQASIMQNLWFFLSPVLRNINFSTLFNINMLFDEFILLTGTWLWGKRIYKSQTTILFVCLTLLGSTIWMSQVWFNFHFYYTIPLILYFFHQFLDEGKWRYLFLAGNLLALQTASHTPYCIPVTSLFIFLYFFFYAIFNLRLVIDKIKNLKFNSSFLLCIAGIILSFGCVLLLLNIQSEHTASYNLGRGSNNTALFEYFLYYGGNTNLQKWLELILAFSPAMDFNIYIGFLPVALAIMALCSVNKNNIHIFLLIITMLLFSMGTIVSAFFYYSWPFMQYFRHLALTTPLVKFLLCIIAGFGFEWLFIKEKTKTQILLMFFIVIIIAFSFTSLSSELFALSADPSAAVKLSNGLITDNLPKITDITASLVIPRVRNSAVFAFLTAVILLTFLFLKSKRARGAIILIGLALHFCDIYGYKFLEISQRTVALKPDQRSLAAFSSLPFQEYRNKEFDKTNPRVSLFNKVILLENNKYWPVYSFLFLDQAGTSMRTDWWAIPLDQFMRAYWGQDINDRTTLPKGLVVHKRLNFPFSHEAVGKFTGVTKEKFQFFQNAYQIESDSEIASYLTDSHFTGDLLFLSSLETRTPSLDDTPLSKTPPDSLETNDRIEISYQVTQFDSNNVKLKLPQALEKPAWLFYSDVWNPYWKAKIDGAHTPVYKASLAYKAIPLKAGTQHIHLYFHCWLITCAYLLIGLNSLFWIGMIFKLARGILKGDRHLANR